MQRLDECEWRPITFQGVAFPATLMGVSILEPVFEWTFKERELIEWVSALQGCVGGSRAPADVCARCAQKIIDLMLENRQLLLDGIRDRLGPHGFDAETTYRDWIIAFQRIVELSATAEGDCVWSAPKHPKDMTSTDARKLNEALERARARFLADEDPKIGGPE